MKKIFKVMCSICAAGIMAISAVSMSGCGMNETEKEAKRKERLARFNLEWRVDLPYDWDLVAFYKTEDPIDNSYYEVRALRDSFDFADRFCADRSEALEQDWERVTEPMTVAAENTVDFDREYKWFVQNRISDNHQYYDVDGLKNVKRYRFCEGVRPEAFEGERYSTLYLIFVPSTSLLYVLSGNDRW